MTAYGSIHCAVGTMYDNLERVADTRGTLFRSKRCGVEDLRCPTCKGSLVCSVDNFRCSACDRSYRISDGIPDFDDDPIAQKPD